MGEWWLVDRRDGRPIVAAVWFTLPSAEHALTRIAAAVAISGTPAQRAMMGHAAIVEAPE